jgi:hypothetical protein
MIAKKSVPPRWTVVAAIAVAAAIAAWRLASPALARIATERVKKSLEEQSDSNLEIQNLSVTVFPRVRITAEGLVFRQNGRTDVPPLITIRRLEGTASVVEVMRRPPHVQRMSVEGLEIHVPPRSEHPSLPRKPGKGETAGFVIDEVIADGTTLTTLPKDARKEPLQWDIRKLTLHGAGPYASMKFQATLVNARPPGDIESAGEFGPWEREDPGSTPVSGKYSFRNADLSVFRGISGKLESDGSYRGVLGRIEVEGHTDTPDFTVKISGNPVHLITQFEAVVDGTGGNTSLQPVKAQFGHSSLIAQGSVDGIIGTKGKTVSLDVTAAKCRLEDMLLLGVKMKKPPMSGVVNFHTKLVIPPGDIDVAQKLKLDGNFEVDSAHFSEMNIQEKVNKLSHSGRGQPEEPETDTVASDFAGRFALDNGLMTFQNLSFRVPGVGVSLNGKYGLLDEKLDFRGTARLDAKLSQATTGFKSFLLKAVDRFVSKKNAGAVLPIKIQGTRDKPSFGLDLR